MIRIVARRGGGATVVGDGGETMLIISGDAAPQVTVAATLAMLGVPHESVGECSHGDIDECRCSCHDDRLVEHCSPCCRYCPSCRRKVRC